MSTTNDFATPATHHAILAQLFERYVGLVCENEAKLADLAPRCQGPALMGLCREAITNGSSYPFDKMNRWLGFVQGVLAAKGIIDVDTERDITRPLLHQLHNAPVKSWPA